MFRLTDENKAALEGLKHPAVTGLGPLVNLAIAYGVPALRAEIARLEGKVPRGAEVEEDALDRLNKELLSAAPSPVPPPAPAPATSGKGLNDNWSETIMVRKDAPRQVPQIPPRPRGPVPMEQALRRR
jgi:hypothetical protein